MRFLIVIFLALISCDTAKVFPKTVCDSQDSVYTYSATPALPTTTAESIFPPNDMYIPEGFEFAAKTDRYAFEKIIDAGYEAFQPEAIANNEIIRINKLWTDGTVNANVSRQNGVVTINMYGGLARLVNPSAFAIVLCHELGHAYGGLPYVYPQGKLSAEGQADWTSTKMCFKRIFDKVQAVQDSMGEYEAYIEEKCSADDFCCRNGLAGSKDLSVLLSNLMKEKTPPAFETPDPYVAPKTMLSYPKTAQCRLDSYAAGLFQKDRPACWFKN